MNANPHDDSTVLAGKYLLEEVIGTGGMGTVYRARHLVLGSPVAVKLMHRSGEPLLAERFLREARLAASARHPNVVSILDFGTTDDAQPFMVMEFLEGRSLSDYIESGTLSLEAQVSIVAQVLSGLDAVHRAGIIHRDLKPANIFVTQLEDGSHFARLLDFGISFSVDPESAMRRGRFGTDQQLIIGTPEYMSFEQAQGQVDIDERADVYAMGVILYELLSWGQLPYADANPGGVLFKIFAGTHLPLERLRPDLPALAAVVERALSSDRRERPSSARALRRELLGAMGGAVAEMTDGSIVLPRDARARRDSDRSIRASDANLGRRATEPGVSSGAPSLPYLRTERRWWRTPKTAAAVFVMVSGVGLAVVLGSAAPEPASVPAATPAVGTAHDPGDRPLDFHTPVSVPSTPPDAGLVAPRERPESHAVEASEAVGVRPRRRAAERRETGAERSGERGRLRRGLIIRDLDF